MTDDKQEERMILVTEEEWRFYLNAWLTSLNKGWWTPRADLISSWDGLVLIPHHTDAEYDELKAKLDEFKMALIKSPTMQAWNESILRERRLRAEVERLKKENEKLRCGYCDEMEHIRICHDILAQLKKDAPPTFTHAEVEAIDWACSEMEYAMDGARLRGARKVRDWLKTLPFEKRPDKED